MVTDVTPDWDESEEDKNFRCIEEDVLKKVILCTSSFTH
jgi:hypothetical protein